MVIVFESWMGPEKRIQILDETVCILYTGNTLRKDMNPAMCKKLGWLCCLTLVRKQICKKRKLILSLLNSS